MDHLRSTEAEAHIYENSHTIYVNATALKALHPQAWTSDSNCANCSNTFIALFIDEHVAMLMITECGPTTWQKWIIENKLLKKYNIVVVQWVFYSNKEKK